MTSCASSPIAHDVAGDLEQARLRGLVGRLAAGRGCRGRSTRQRSSLRRTGIGDVAILEHLAEVDLLDGDGGVAVLGPDLGRTAALRGCIRESSDSIASSRCSAATVTSPAKVSCRMSRSWSQRAASAMAPASRPPTAMPATSSVSGVTPNGEHLAGRGLGDRGAQPVERPRAPPDDRAGTAPSSAPQRPASGREPRRSGRLPVKGWGRPPLGEGKRSR